MRGGPLSPLVFLRRNARQTVPLTAVITLAVMLVAGIIAMVDSIPYSIRTIYSYSKEFTGITPRGDPTQTPILLAEVKKESPIPLDRVVICRISSSQIRSIVGKWPFFVLGLSRPDMDYYLKVQRSTGIDGRLPRPGAAEAVISEPVARNLSLKLGSIVQGPELDESYSPKPVKVVGIARTDRWLMASSIEYLQNNHFPPIDLGLVFAKDRSRQEELDRWADDHFKGRRAGVAAYHQIEKNTEEMFATLYRILDLVIATLVIVITFMMGMLMNIYQSQRLVEFGLLQAIGHTKRSLVRRVVIEAVIVIALGWILGAIAAYLLLSVSKATLMDPNAYQLDVFDPVAYRYTMPLPFAVLIVAVVTLKARFRQFDPIGVVERRVV